MKSIFLLLTALLFSFSSYAEEKLARINDADGYTNIRAGEGVNFEILDVVVDDEFFICEESGRQWLKIRALKNTGCCSFVEGYMHKSRVQFIEKLPDSTQKQLLLEIFNKQKQLTEEYLGLYDTYRLNEGWQNSKDSLQFIDLQKKSGNHSEYKYQPVLYMDILSSYFCRTKDVDVLAVFYETLWADRGSASENPGFAVGACYICHPELTLEPVRTLPGRKKELVLGHIVHGLYNVWNEPENKEFKRLLELLENEF